jgi:uncharacterized protein (DUF427 family)
MSTRVRTAVTSGLGGLRHEPTAKRIRAKLGEHTVVDSTHAVLLWEPRRVVPTWAVPVGDIGADLRKAAPAAETDGDVGLQLPDVSQRPVLDPTIPFATHTAEGDVIDVVTPHGVLTAAGLTLHDPDLEGYVVLDFAAFDSWWEEDEPNLGHPRDPFHRIDVLHSSRHVRIELDAEVLAESSCTYLLFETMLPVRFYFAREHVVAELVPSQRRTTCAYKGHATYFSPVVAGSPVPDLGWTYEAPLREAAEITGRIAFFNERADFIVDGTKWERPITPWSR